MAIQNKATEQYFYMVLFTMLYKVILTFKSVNKTLVCDHSNECYWAVLPYGTAYYALQGLTFVDYKPRFVSIQIKAI